MQKILVVQPLHPKALAMLEARSDIEFEVVTDFAEENLLQRVADADGITVRDAKLSEAVLAAAPKLRVVSRHGVGFDNIPVNYCSSRGIPVTVVGPVNAISVAEHTIFLMLAAARVGVHLDQSVRDGRFSERSNSLSLELSGKTILLIGYGRIGREVAKRARAFNMEVAVYDPYLNATEEGVTRFASLEEALPTADVVSLHVPLTPETRNILGAEELALLPLNAIVVNASRGGLIDETALAEAVARGAIHGAGLDTFDQEPLPVTSPLVGQNRIVLSPHSAALTEGSLIAMGMKTVENVLGGLDGRLDAQFVVNAAAIEGK
ncbi:hydroxyacid dehydrogenase [Labrys okinawensis]|uniref:hydroxyacid dehydrogenase n=1 Tax=Labrys okinawensis TaxID=346911 RepID=UPI0039BD366D